MEDFSKNYIIPAIRVLEINYLDKEDDLFTHFLNKSIINPMYNCHINSKGLEKFQMKSKLPFTPYREIILKTIKNVKESVKLGFFHFNVSLKIDNALV